MPSLQRYPPRTWILWSALLLACAFLTTLVSITVVLATRVSSITRTIYCTAVAASSMDILALAASVLLVLLSQRQLPRRLLPTFCAVSALVTASATFLTLYFLIAAWGQFPSPRMKQRWQAEQILTVAGIAVCAFAVMIQVILHTAILWTGQKERPFLLPMHISQRSTTPTKLVKRSVAGRAPTPLLIPATRASARSESEPISSAFSAYSDSVRTSFRSSLIRVISPTTWKMKLLSHSQLAVQDANSIPSPQEDSAERRRASEGIAQRQDTPTSPATPLGRTRFFKRNAERTLESIPGSRPASPGKLLDGPFAERPPPVLESSRPSYASDGSANAGTMREPSLRDSGDRGQLLVHPLFRDENRIPPPLASPGTVISASPYAGQVIAFEQHAFTGGRTARCGLSDPFVSSSLSSLPRSPNGTARFHVPGITGASTSEPILPGLDDEIVTWI